MKIETQMLSLIIAVKNLSIPEEITDDALFAYFKPLAIEILKNGATEINHFGLTPDNGAEGIDELLTDGVLFRFDVTQDILGIDVEAEPNITKQAFLSVVEKRNPQCCFILEEIGATKKETTLVFQFLDL